MLRLRAAALIAGTTVAGVTLTACGGTAGTTASSSASSRVAAPAPTGSPGTSSAAEADASPPPATESNPPGDIPDNQAYVEYRPQGSPVAVKVPEGWARTTASTALGNAVLFSDKLNRIAVTTSTASRALTPQSVQATIVPRLTASVPKFALTSVQPVTRPAGTGVLVRYQGDSPQDPVTGKVVRDAFEQYLFARGGRLVSLTLAGPTNADNVDPWRIVSTSLRWL